MKKFLLSLSLLLIGIIVSNGQAISVYHEDFENADSVTTSGAAPAWTYDGSLNTTAGGVFSFRRAVSTSSVGYLETNAFNTTGNTYVILHFNHICKVEFFDAGEIEVSNDNGVNWTKLLDGSN